MVPLKAPTDDAVKVRMTGIADPELMLKGNDAVSRTANAGSAEVMAVIRPRSGAVGMDARRIATVRGDTGGSPGFWWRGTCYRCSLLQTG